LLAAIIFLTPLIWMIATSAKPETQAASGTMSLLPDPPSIAPQTAADQSAGLDGLLRQVAQCSWGGRSR